MGDSSKVQWTGASGMKYTYFIHALPTNFNAGQDGNYIYSKLESNFWKPIYIGQGDLKSRTDVNGHHQSACLKSKGATHVHVHLNGVEEDRLAEERDLLAGYPQAYKPVGCNEREGG